MTEITRDDVQSMMSVTTEDEKPKLVMVASEASFATKHIPESLNANSIQQGMAQIEKDDKVIVYGCNEGCGMTKTAYNLLSVSGYESVYYYPGGLAEWEAEGLPLASKG